MVTTCFRCEVPAFSWTLETCVVTRVCGTLGAGLQQGPSNEQTTCQGISQGVPEASREAGLVVRTPVRQIAEEFEISVDSVRRWVKLAKLDKCPRKRRHFTGPQAVRPDRRGSGGRLHKRGGGRAEGAAQIEPQAGRCRATSNRWWRWWPTWEATGDVSTIRRKGTRSCGKATTGDAGDLSAARQPAGCPMKRGAHRC